jgi:hypothetical protein
MSAAPQPTINPITQANDWMYAMLGGVPTPGTIPRNGIKGFKRETGWDKKKGKGTQGATLTLTSQPPCEGSITLQLFTKDDFDNWDVFVLSILSIPAAKQKAQGLSVYHPQFASLGLIAVVVKSYTGPEHQGKGLYTATIELIEWNQPPPVSIVSTPPKVAPDKPDSNSTVTPPDPEIAALQQQIALLNQANKP